ncbi:MAG TPA: hypothetical protein PKA00_01415 [Saprospiraceae bacterium]|nr:hypothetical protein [Saprospiraceae bacterium]HMQ81527.1 hypothetical protein [Saprospiraceae bacterium]
MINQDRLWKAILEDFFVEAVQFFFKDLFLQINWQQGYEVLDKELREIFPNSAENERRADLLVKVFLQDGTEQWILIHVEIQGYKDDNFAKRMFTYFYRLTDRFNVPIVALALFTDADKNWCPDRYEVSYVSTHLIYKYATFKLAHYQAADFDIIQNPWAMVMQSALIGLKKQWKDEALLEAKVNLYRKLREKGYNQEQSRHLLQFIKYYVRFHRKDFFHKFEHVIQSINQDKPTSMGIIELVKEHLLQEAKEQGLEQGHEQGLEQGLEQGELKKAITGIRNMTKLNFEAAVMASILNVPEEFVLEIKQQLLQEPQIVARLQASHSNTQQIAQELEVHPLLVAVIKGE